jgi:hypothetical protein
MPIEREIYTQPYYSLGRNNPWKYGVSYINQEDQYYNEVDYWRMRGFWKMN